MIGKLLNNELVPNDVKVINIMWFQLARETVSQLNGNASANVKNASTSCDLLLKKTHLRYERHQSITTKLISQ